MKNKSHQSRNLIYTAVFTLMVFSPSSYATNIGSDLMHFFKNVGMASNVTTPGSHKDQAAGYYTGGSMTVRNGVKNAQVATLQMPGFRAGCGGIDLWTGGFSHISSDQIIEMLRNIGSSAASYAFMLAIQTISPQTYNIMNELNALATQINQTNINSCETAATLLGGVWPKTDQSSKHLCQSMGSQLGTFSDYAAARQGCGANGDREKVLSQRSGDPRYKNMFAGEFNLAWRAIQLNSFLFKSRPLAELFLTLVGSIIVQKKGEFYQVTNLPSHVDRDDVLNGLMNGGQTPVYVCDSDECLAPSMKQVVIAQNSALLRKTQLILETLVHKIYEDEPLSSEEKDFLNSTRLPVYKMLNVITAFRKGHAPLDIHQYGELIALDILHKYVLEVIDIVHDSVVQLRSVQVDEAHMERFLEQLRYARERVLERRRSAYQHMDSTLSMIQATQLIEKQLHAMMGSVANENNGM
jgi:conjugative transfer pilus assembly protein TraH